MYIHNGFTDNAEIFIKGDQSGDIEIFIHRGHTEEAGNTVIHIDKLNSTAVSFNFIFEIHENPDSRTVNIADLGKIENIMTTGMFLETVNDIRSE